MAEISKETRDAILSELSEADLNAELARRRTNPYEMKVKYYPPMYIQRDCACLRIIVSSNTGPEKVRVLLDRLECEELIRRIKQEMGL
jgi:hypothetical protein